MVLASHTCLGPGQAVSAASVEHLLCFVEPQVRGQVWECCMACVALEQDARAATSNVDRAAPVSKYQRPGRCTGWRSRTQPTLPSGQKHLPPGGEARTFLTVSMAKVARLSFAPGFCQQEAHVQPARRAQLPGDTTDTSQSYRGTIPVTSTCAHTERSIGHWSSSLIASESLERR